VRNLKGRLFSLERIIPGSVEGEPFKSKAVDVVAESGPPIEWANPAYLTLRVPQEAWADPLAALTEEQAALIRPGDELFIVPVSS
jgi:hypothetical protein